MGDKRQQGNTSLSRGRGSTYIQGSILLRRRLASKGTGIKLWTISEIELSRKRRILSVSIHFGGNELGMRGSQCVVAGIKYLIEMNICCDPMSGLLLMAACFYSCNV